MKIASGLEKMPDVYIIDDPALNAFATGRDPKRASVAITSGLLEKLNRDELQGVIAHEIAHVKNRDVLLMSLCSVLLGTIVILSWYATHMLFFSSMTGGRRGSGGGGSGGAIILLIGIVLMILAPIFAQLIYFAISRKREYLADASSAQYTRYPEGLASALEKLGGSKIQVQSASQATAPMYIVNPFRKKGKAATDLSSTHPPLSERIRILRSMAGGASFVDYNSAYQQVHKGGGAVLPASALAAAAPVGLRAAGPAAPAEPEPSKVERTREVSDLMWRKNDYRTINCDCGTRLRVPPKLKKAKVRCPHCGRTHPL
jgi:heat shock protein HtpX